MDRYIIIILILILGATAIPLFSDGHRGITTYIEGIDPNLKVGKQYLVVIGINEYQHWLPLHSPVNDVQEIRDILLSRYYIDEVFELYDAEATKANIIKLVVKLQKKVDIDDSVLILYSGHGHLDENSNFGFWVPVNGGTDVYKQLNWLPHTQLKGLIENIKASHICVISDSCFAGDLIHSTRSILPTIDTEYFKRSYSRVSRQVLTSGATETVPDNSEFAEQLKSILMRNQNRFLDTLMLYNEVRLGVESSIPLFGALGGTGHQEGASFVLFLREESQSKPTPFGPIQLEPGPSAATVGEQRTVYLTTGLIAGWLIPVAEMAPVMDVGLNLRTQLHINHGAGWGVVGFGLSTGFTHLVAEQDTTDHYGLSSVPLALNMRYISISKFRFFWSVDLSVGAMFNVIAFPDGAEKSLITSKPFLSPTLSLGRQFFESWSASAYGSYLLILFDNTCFSGIATGIRVQYMF